MTSTNINKFFTCVQDSKLVDITVGVMPTVIKSVVKSVLIPEVS